MVMLYGSQKAVCATKVGDLWYSLDGGIHVACVVAGDYTGLKDVVIPSKIAADGVEYHVTEIAARAFAETSTLTSVEIPGSIELISAYAFSKCPELKTVRIKNGVKGIGNFAFQDCEKLEVLELPTTSLRNIYEASFINCNSLVNLNLPEGLEGIGVRAFQVCKSLKEVRLPDSVTNLQLGAFEYCDSLKKVTLGKNTSYIGESVFRHDFSLEEITFQCKISTNRAYAFDRTGNIKRINISSLSDWLNSEFSGNNPMGANKADLYCNGKKVTDLVIPEDITSIMGYAFYNCTSLKNIRIPKHVSQIPDFSAFGGTKLNSFIIDDSPEPISVGSTFINMEADSIYIGRKMNITEQINPVVKTVAFGDELDEIYATLFQNCSQLQKIDLNKVRKVGTKGFYGCGNLRELNLRNVSEIEAQAFDRCNYLHTIKIETSTPPIVDASSFSQSTFKTAQLIVPIGAKNTYAKAEVWKNFTRIVETGTNWVEKEVTLSTSGSLMNKISMSDIERIGKLKVSGDINGTDILLINKMVNMYSLDLSDTNIRSGGMPYYEDDKSSMVTEDDVLNRYWAYGLGFVKELKLPKTIKRLGDYACENLIFVESLTLPSAVSAIGTRVFNGMNSLKELILEDGDEILSGGYDNYLSIENLYLGRTISTSYPRIGGNLKTLTVSPNVASIPLHLFGSGTTSNIPALERIDISDLEAWCRIGMSTHGSNPLWSGAKMYLNGELMETLEFPSTLDNVKPYSFAGYKWLKEASIPSSVKTINEEAFNTCSNLKHISIPNSVNVIKGGVFANSGLSSIELPYSIESIERYTFHNCASLSAISIPASVKKIGENAFVDCKKLKKVTVANHIPPTMNEKSFDDAAFTNIPLYIPKESSFIYYLHPFWSKFMTREELPGGYFSENPVKFSVDETNGNEAIITPSTDATGDIVIPENVEVEGKTYTVTSITPEAFKDNTTITSIVIPETVKYIGYDAFNGCSNLKELTIGNPNTSRSFRLPARDDNEETEPIVIGENAFASCSKLGSVKCDLPVPPRAPENAFPAEVYANAVLEVPSISFDDYRNSEYCWSKFVNATSGIEDIMTDRNDTLSVVDGEVVAADSEEWFEVYNISGVKVCEGRGRSSSRLERGIYIVRIAGKSVKVII